MSLGNVKLGICEWALPKPLRGPTVCRVARDFGLDGVELELGVYEEHLPLGDPYILNLYKEAAEKTGIVYTGVACNLTDYFSNTTTQGHPDKEVVEYAGIRGIDCAAALGAPLIHMPAFGPSLIRTEQDMIYTAETFRKFCDYAADKNVKICTENVLNAEKMLQLIKLVDRPNFYLYFDTENYSIHGQNVPDLVEPLFDYIPEFHVKDGFDAYSTHLIGKGGAKVFETLQKFADLGYSGYIVLDNYYSNPPLCGRSDDPMELLKKDAAIMKEWIAAN